MTIITNNNFLYNFFIYNLKYFIFYLKFIYFKLMQIIQFHKIKMQDITVCNIIKSQKVVHINDSYAKINGILNNIFPHI